MFESFSFPFEVKKEVSRVDNRQKNQEVATPMSEKRCFIDPNANGKLGVRLSPTAYINTAVRECK